MPETVSAALQDHIDNHGITTYCLKVKLIEDSIIGKTIYTEDIPFDAGDGDGEINYEQEFGFDPITVTSKIDMSVGSSSVQGIYDETNFTLPLMAAGKIDGATYELFLLNPLDKSMGRLVLSSGSFGDITLDPLSGFEVALRDLMEELQQDVGPIYSVMCRSILGASVAEEGMRGGCRNPDAGDGVTLSDYTFSGTVTRFDDDRLKFRTNTISGTDVQGNSTDVNGYFDRGIVTWTSGNNNGFQMEVRQDGGHVFSGGEHRFELVQEMFSDIQVNDTFDISAGCDHVLTSDCKDKFDNVINYRAEFYVPGKVIQTQSGKRLDL